VLTRPSSTNWWGGSCSHLAFPPQLAVTGVPSELATGERTRASRLLEAAHCPTALHATGEHFRLCVPL